MRRCRSVSGASSAPDSAPPTAEMCVFPDVFWGGSGPVTPIHKHNQRKDLHQLISGSICPWVEFWVDLRRKCAGSPASVASERPSSLLASRSLSHHTPGAFSRPSIRQLLREEHSTAPEHRHPLSSYQVHQGGGVVLAMVEVCSAPAAIHDLRQPLDGPRYQNSAGAAGTPLGSRWHMSSLLVRALRVTLKCPVSCPRLDTL